MSRLNKKLISVAFFLIIASTFNLLLAQGNKQILRGIDGYSLIKNQEIKEKPRDKASNIISVSIRLAGSKFVLRLNNLCAEAEDVNTHKIDVLTDNQGTKWLGLNLRDDSMLYPLAELI
ncbi:MAG: hypothetical protein PHR45_06605 [Muribaculaceae bacterium]|nr:hypothetical protein [Muribaculaceae bacterium]